MRRLLVCLAFAAVLGVVHAQTVPSEVEADRNPKIHTGGTVLIHGGRVLTITHGQMDGADVLIVHGKIAQIGMNLKLPVGATQIDAHGLFVTPGIVDAHSHRAESFTNEGTDSITPEVRIWDDLDPDSLGLYFALASGITTELSLHGSANAIGGQSVVIKNKWRRPLSEILFPGAPRMVKFALGENPREVNGRNPSAPSRYAQTRLGVESIYRRAFADAREYIKKQEAYEKLEDRSRATAPRRDLRLEQLADILKGKIWVQCHSYRQDEILMMARLSKEFGFHLVLQHALESYKIAPELAQMKVPVSMFGDGFAYKLEVVDSMPLATAICDAAGVLVSVNTDSDTGISPLSQDAGKSMRYGVSEDHALRMLTLNPAMELGVENRVGSLDVGKDGDIAIWDGHPLSVYSKCVYALIDGEVEFQRRDAFHLKSPGLAATSVSAQPFSPDAPPVTRSRAYLIDGAMVHPVSGPDLPTGNVLIVDGKISAVSAEAISAPAGATVIDGKGLHVYPGLIDCGSVLGLVEIGSVPQAADIPEGGDYLPDLWAGAAINPESVHFPKARFNGLTNSLVRAAGSLFEGQCTFINDSGLTTEEMILSKKAALAVAVPSGMSDDAVATSKPEDLEKARTAVYARRTAIKEYFERAKRYLAAKAADPSLETDVKLEAMRAYLERKAPVIFDASDPSAIRFVIALSKDIGLKPIVSSGGDAWKLASLLAANNVPVILSAPAIACPSADTPANSMDPYDSPLVAAAVLREAGVTVAFESTSFDDAMNLPYRVGRFCAFGMSHDDALRGLTLDAAKIFGMDRDLGSLEPGKMGNVIVTDGDPLELTTHVKYEFIGGQPVSLQTHYTELFKKYMGRVQSGGK